ncbi:hypothetical protein QUA41_03165 [Microcoleus sp. Pol11C1]|uniref:hypothetical protein n=1 Tax=unclassified Microcoleus TaxID=2642155 RepID=UPI002FD0B744
MALTKNRKNEIITKNSKFIRLIVQVGTVLNIPGVTRKDNVSTKQPIAPFAPFAPPHPRSHHTPACPTPQPIKTKR